MNLSKIAMALRVVIGLLKLTFSEIIWEPKNAHLTLYKYALLLNFNFHFFQFFLCFLRTSI